MGNRSPLNYYTISNVIDHLGHVMDPLAHMATSVFEEFSKKNKEKQYLQISDIKSHNILTGA